MKVRSISSDSDSRDEPSLDEVEAAVRALDGATVTMITLEITEEHHMGIGGGKGGQYVVYMTKDNMRFWNLEDPSRGEEVVMLVCGGQEGDFQARRCVTLDAALRAARAFASTGEPAPDLPWVSD